MTLDRREFLQGLVAAAVVASIPAAPYEFNKLPPTVVEGLDEYAEKYIKPAMETLAGHIDRDLVRFTQDYDIDRDALILRADYRPDEEHHYAAAVHLDDIKDEEITEVEDMLHHAIEQRIYGRQ